MTQVVKVRVIDNETDPVLSVLAEKLGNARDVKIATAFVKQSGVTKVAKCFERVCAGSDRFGTVTAMTG